MTDIFEDSKTPAPVDQDGGTPAPQPAVSDGYDQLLANIRNEEGKPKYADVQSALNGAAHAQTFIAQLKSENAQKEQELAQLREQVEQLQSLTSVLKGKATPPDGAASSDPETVEALVQRALEAERQAQEQNAAKTAAATNVEKFIAAANEAFGNDRAAKLKELTQKAGLTEAEAQELAQKNPDFLIRSLGITKPASPAKIPPGHNATRVAAAANSAVDDQPKTGKIGDFYARHLAKIQAAAN